jgi:hypothetical protein
MDMWPHRIIRSIGVVLILISFATGLSVAGQGDLMGLVVDAENLAPISALPVILENDSISYSTTTDIEGNYAFQNIPDGIYDVYVGDDEYIKLPKEVSICANETAIVNLAAIALDLLSQDRRPTQAASEDTAGFQTWKGNWRDSEGLESGSLILNAQISRTKIKGSMTATRTVGCGTLKIPCSGTISDRDVHIQGSSTNPCLGGGKRKFVFVGILSPKGTRLTGTYGIHRGKVRVADGTFSLRRK